jgi:hypothetical protein
LAPPQQHDGEDWGADVSLYKLSRLWMNSGVDTSSFSLPESVLLGMHDDTPPLILPAPIPQQGSLAPPAQPTEASVDFDVSSRSGVRVTLIHFCFAETIQNKHRYASETLVGRSCRTFPRHQAMVRRCFIC